MRRATGTGLAALIVAGSLAVPAVAVARHGDDDGPGDDRREQPARADRDRDRGEVRVRGACTISSTAKLKVDRDLDEDDGPDTEIEFEVDENRVGSRWTVTIAVDGRRIAAVTRTTRAPSGSFELERERNLRAGARVTAVARRAATGEVCRATAVAR
ncbi:MAG: hypothetical protein AB7V42_13045 [Thermoleophilia bacterium]